MASLLWGNVFYNEIYAGILREELGDRMVLEYDSAYIQTGHPLAYTLPLQSEPHVSYSGLHPFFDNLVAACLYDYKTMALALDGASNLAIGNLKAKHIVGLGNEYGLSQSAIQMSCDQLKKAIPNAKAAIENASVGTSELKTNLIEILEKRWNGTFALIGQHLSKRQ
jgi:HipA-like protein